MPEDGKLDALIAEIQEARTEGLALQAVCAILIGEIALKDEDPKGKLANIVAALQGMADGVAGLAAVEGSPQASLTMTRTIERVSAMAELVLRPERG